MGYFPAGCWGWLIGSGSAWGSPDVSMAATAGRRTEEVRRPAFFDALIGGCGFPILRSEERGMGEAIYFARVNGFAVNLVLRWL